MCSCVTYPSLVPNRRPVVWIDDGDGVFSVAKIVQGGLTARLIRPLKPDPSLWKILSQRTALGTEVS